MIFSWWGGVESTGITHAAASERLWAADWPRGVGLRGLAAVTAACSVRHLSPVSSTFLPSCVARAEGPAGRPWGSVTSPPLPLRPSRPGVPAHPELPRGSLVAPRFVLIQLGVSVGLLGTLRPVDTQPPKPSDTRGECGLLAWSRPWVLKRWLPDSLCPSLCAHHRALRPFSC